MERNYYIDIIAGLMIITMALTHTYDERMQIDILNFFMPWFFFKSGMYFKVQNINNVAMKGAEKLLYPFVTFGFIGYIANAIKRILDGDTNWIHYTLTPLKEITFTGAVEGNLPLWFLLTLFLVRIFYRIVYTENIVRRMLVIAFIIIGIFIVNQINGYAYFPKYITNSITGLFFYACGNLMRNIYKNTSVWLLSTIIFFCVYFLDNPTMIMGSNILQSGHYILWFVFSLAGCIMINGLFERMQFRFYVLHWIGINSMVIYVSHYVVIELFNILTGNVLSLNLSSDIRLVLLIPTMVIAEFLIVHIMKKPSFQILIKPQKAKV